MEVKTKSPRRVTRREYLGHSDSSAKTGIETALKFLAV